MPPVGAEWAYDICHPGLSHLYRMAPRPCRSWPGLWNTNLSECRSVSLACGILPCGQRGIGRPTSCKRRGFRPKSKSIGRSRTDPRLSTAPARSLPSPADRPGRKLFRHVSRAVCRDFPVIGPSWKQRKCRIPQHCRPSAPVSEPPATSTLPLLSCRPTRSSLPWFVRQGSAHTGDAKFLPTV